MKINLKNSKGITIITLIITIIVMIILATISIKYGLRSINSVQDSTIETGLETVQQALIQQYTKVNSIGGDKKEYYGTPQSEKDIEKILEKHGVKGSENKFNLLNFDYTNNKYTSTVTEDNAYYLLNPSDLEKLGITGAKGSSYLVNYSTGEVWDLGNVKYDDGEYAYINGIGTELEIAKEDFVDSPIKISLVGDVKAENGKYKITLRVTDDLAKISNDPNDKNKHITKQDIIDNIITLKIDDTKVDESKIEVKDPIVKPDDKQSIKEYYEYVIEVQDSTGGGKDFPELDIIINEGAIEDVKDYPNPKTELSAIINDSTKNQPDITFSLGKPAYETKNEDYPDGYTDKAGITWGTSANVALTLECPNGLKSQDYVFNYTFGSEEKQKITLRAREGEKTVTGIIRLDSYTGSGTLKVSPANPNDTGRNSKKIGSTEKTVGVNLDNETVSIDSRVGDKTLKEYIDNGGYFRLNIGYDNITEPIPSIEIIMEDNESGLKVAPDGSTRIYDALTDLDRKPIEDVRYPLGGLVWYNMATGKL